SARRPTARVQERRGPRRGAPALLRAPPPSPRRAWSALVHRHQVAHEDQGRVRGDHRRGALGAVAEGGGGVETAGAGQQTPLTACALPHRPRGGRGQRLCTATRSHTKIRASFGAITGGAPWAP